MSYYMGDFYPRGDPGIGSFLGGLAKRAFSAVAPLMPGGSIVKAAAGAVTAAAKGTVRRGAEAVAKHPVLSAAAGAGVVGAAMGAGGEVMMHPSMGGVHGRGMHPCKNKRHGCKHGAMVPNRRMNPFNPRAARRAARRLHSLVRHYRKYVGFVSARKPKGRPYFKAGRKKR